MSLRTGFGSHNSGPGLSSSAAASLLRPTSRLDVSVGSGSGSSLRDATLIDRRIDEERAQREQAIASLDRKFTAELKRSGSGSDSPSSIRGGGGGDDVRAKLRGLEDRLDALEPIRDRVAEIEEVIMRLDPSDVSSARSRVPSSTAASPANRRGLGQRSFTSDVDTNHWEGLEDRALMLGKGLHEKLGHVVHSKVAGGLSSLSGSLAERGALEALDKQVANDMSRLASDLRESEKSLKRHYHEDSTKLQESFKSLEEKLRQEVGNLSDEQRATRSSTDALHRTTLEDLESRLEEKLRQLSNEQHAMRSSTDALHRASLERVEEKLQAKIAETSAEHSDAHTEHRELHRTTLDAFEAKLLARLADTSAEHGDAHSEHRELHKASLAAMGAQLEQEVARLSSEQDDHRGNHSAALEALEVRLFGELSRASSDQSGAHLELSEDLEAKLRQEIERLSDQSGAHLERHEALEVKLRQEIEAKHSSREAQFEDHRTATKEEMARMAADQRKVSDEHRSSQAAVLAAMDTQMSAEVARLSGQHEGNQHAMVDSLEATLRQDMSDLAQEHRVEQDRQNTEHKAALDVVNGLAEEAASQHQHLRRRAMEVEAQLRDEILAVSGPLQESHDILRMMITEQKDDLERKSEQKEQVLRESVTRQIDGLRESYERKHCEKLGSLEASLREEMDGSHSHLDFALKAALEALDAKLREAIKLVSSETQESNSVLTGLLEEFRKDAEAKHVAKQAMHEQALGGLEERLRLEIEERHDRLGSAHQAKLEELDVKLKEDTSRVSSANRESHEELHALLSEQKDESRRAYDRRLKEEVSGRQDQLGSTHRAELEVLGSKLEEYVASVSRAQREGHDMLMGLIAEQREELCRSLDAKHLEQAEALLTLERKLMGEVEGRHAELDGCHKLALETMRTRLKQDIDHVSSAHQEGQDGLRRSLSDRQAEMDNTHGRRHTEHAESIESLEVRLREEIAGAHSGSSAMFEALDARLKEEIDRLSNGHLQGHDSLRGLVAAHQDEVRASNDQMLLEHRGSVEALEEKLREEMERQSQANASHRAALSALEAQVKTETASRHRELQATQQEALIGIQAKVDGLTFPAGERPAQAGEQPGTAAVEALQGEFGRRHEALKGEFGRRHEELTAAHHAALAPLEARFARLEDLILTLSGEPWRDALDALEGRLGGLHRDLESSRGLHRDRDCSIRALEVRVEEVASSVVASQGKEAHEQHHRLAAEALENELASRHEEFETSQRAALQSLEARVDGLANAPSSVRSVPGTTDQHHRLAVMALESELASRHQEFENIQKEALQSLEARINGLMLDWAALQSLEAQVDKPEAPARGWLSPSGVQDQTWSRSTLCENTVGALEARVEELATLLSSQGNEAGAGLDALGSRIGRVEVALHAADTTLRELARESAEHRSGRAALVGLVQEQAGQRGAGDASKAELEAMGLRVQDLFAKHTKLETLQRTSQALNTELREEMASSNQQALSNAHKTAMESLDSKFDTQLKGAVQTMEDKLREELSRVSDEHHSAAKLRLDVAKANLDTDAEAREWFFSSTRDFLEEVARGMKDLQTAISQEKGLREELERRMSAPGVQRSRTLPVEVVVSPAIVPPVQQPAPEEERPGCSPSLWQGSLQQVDIDSLASSENSGLGSRGVMQLAPQIVQQRAMAAPKVQSPSVPSVPSTPLQQYVPPHAPWASQLKIQQATGGSQSTPTLQSMVGSMRVPMPARYHA